MRNLTRLTNAANKIENGPKLLDRRKSPRCAQCKRAAEWLGGDEFLPHCHRHWTEEEYQRYKAAWRVNT